VIDGYFQYENDISTCVKICPSGYYLNNISGQCMLCDISCLGCNTSETHCIACNIPNGYYPLDGSPNQCYYKPPDGYWRDNFNQLIKLCNSPCLTCDPFNPDICFSCKTQINFYPLVDFDKKCYITCPDGYWLDLTEDMCNYCDISCITCSNSATNCLSCNINDFYYPVFNNTSQCLMNPPPGYWKDDINQKIQACEYACETCVVNDGSRCLVCNITGGYYPLVNSSTSCYNICPDGYWKDLTNKICDYCDVSCYSCLIKEPNCISCNKTYGYYPLVDHPNICLTSPPNDYWKNGEEYDLCDISCATCHDGTKVCDTCNITYEYYPLEDNISSCNNPCPDGYWLDLDNIQCSKCDIQCITCVNSADYCNTCNITYGYYPLIDDSHQCYYDAPPRHWKDTPNQIFQLCDMSCYTCHDSTSICDSCNIPSNYYPLEDKSYTCLTIAPDRYYLDLPNLRFSLCDISCLKCIDNTTYCITCNMPMNYFPLSTNPNSCHNPCPDNYWLDYPNSVCNLCDISCYLCKDNTRNCLQCNTNYYPVENTQFCYLENDIPETYFFDNSTQMFLSCSFPCNNCINNATTCVDCVDNYYKLIDSPICINPCPDNYYSNIISNKNYCSKCQYPCAKCQSSLDCITCVEGFLLVENLDVNNCMTDCPQGYYLDNTTNTCKLCDSNCLTCVSNSTYCTSCDPKLYYNPIDHNCLQSCGIGFYYSNLNQTCEPCDISCKICQNVANYCNVCNPGYYYIEETSQCVVNCPDNYYNNYTDSTCSLCYLNCKTCQGPNINDCLSCNLSSKYNYLKDGECVNLCGDYEILIPENNQCLNLKDCIGFASLDADDLVYVTGNSFDTSIILILNDNCIQYKDLVLNSLTFNWLGANNGTLSNDNTTLSIDINNITYGDNTFIVNVIYNSNLITQISKEVYFKENEVLIFIYILVSFS
jgi:proprotein convertase subtilisin/kexin type 5